MKIVIASDHAGYSLKSKLYSTLRIVKGITIEDVGTHSLGSCDFPDYANALCEKMKSDEYTFGILVCGSGMGMNMAANRHKHIRCALCRSSDDAFATRQHNNANVIALGEQFTSQSLAIDIVFKFINTEFLGTKDIKNKRYQDRMQMIS